MLITKTKIDTTAVDATVKNLQMYILLQNSKFPNSTNCFVFFPARAKFFACFQSIITFFFFFFLTTVIRYDTDIADTNEVSQTSTIFT